MDDVVGVAIFGGALSTGIYVCVVPRLGSAERANELRVGVLAAVIRGPIGVRLEEAEDSAVISLDNCAVCVRIHVIFIVIIKELKPLNIQPRVLLGYDANSNLTDYSIFNGNLKVMNYL